MIDLFCGLGGFTEGGLAEGYEVVGFDIERHVYGSARYPAQLVLQDVLTIHGRQNPVNDGRKAPAGTQWFNDGPRTPDSLESMGGKSSARKAARAHIAKIPTVLARHIARTCYPETHTRG